MVWSDCFYFLQTLIDKKNLTLIFSLLKSYKTIFLNLEPTNPSDGSFGCGHCKHTVVAKSLATLENLLEKAKN